MMCNYGTCTSTDVRIYVVGPRCREHSPAALANRAEPPSDKLPPRRAPSGKSRSYTYEARKRQDDAAKRGRGC